MESDLAFCALAVSIVNYWYLYSIRAKVDKLNRLVSDDRSRQSVAQNIKTYVEVLETAQRLVLAGKYKEAQKLIVDNVDEVDEMVKMFRVLEEKRKQREK
jgi:hypothetical protein